MQSLRFLGSFFDSLTVEQPRTDRFGRTASATIQSAEAQYNNHITANTELEPTSAVILGCCETAVDRRATIRWRKTAASCAASMHEPRRGLFKKHQRRIPWQKLRRPRQNPRQ